MATEEIMESKFKIWLNRNKIYFETITSLFLTIMAILLSFFSYLTTVRQAETEELLNQPIIKIYSEKFPYFNSTTDNSEFLIFENTGAKVNSFDSKVFLFLKIETENPATNKSGDRIVIYKRISDYYGGSTSHNNVVGKLMTYINLGNLHKVYNVGLSFKEKYDDEFPITHISLEKFVKIKYQDFKNKEYQHYYKIDDVHNRKVEPQLIEGMIKEHDIFSMISIQNITPDYIKELIVQIKGEN